MDKEFDYKATINLPKTGFPMKANLAQREPGILEKWQKQSIYKKMLNKFAQAEKYILHDGPPYANGHIHLGHALNKVLKDIIVKYKSIRGFYAPYVPGWDCHGLPVEHQLFKKLNKRKDEVNKIDFREKARDFALNFVHIQKEEFERLGIFGDWDNPYLTLNHRYEAAIIRSFGALVKKGYVYKGCKPVNWCYNCETALAEAEVEYEEHSSPSIYVKFKLNNPDKLPGFDFLRLKQAYIVIWTTTPWTLLGNVACCMHPDFIYTLVAIEDYALLIEENLVDSVLQKAGINNYEIIQKVKGSDLENITYEHPFGLRSGKVVFADYVCGTDGSGIVHTAPGYGAEDFLTGNKYNLELVMQVNAKGCFFDDVADFGGMHIRKANPEVINKLKKTGMLLSEGQITHSYPHCWRCKKPIIFRATDQWFMSIDAHNLREEIIKEIKNVVWIPASAEKRILSMVENRPDWCLSRQRLWGVPIPVFYCANCNKEILDAEVIEKFAKIVEQSGADAWFIKEPLEILPQGYVCPECGSSDFIKEQDILDVWFDSGVSHQAVINLRQNLQYPADLYLEGSDQHRGWFQAALISAMAIDGHTPFKQVLTHGFIVDKDGKKMAKSRGNVIAPQKVISKLGADVLRLYVALSDYTLDVRISEEILDRVSESYRKIRNTLKFILGNLYDFDPRNNSVDSESLLEIDRWAQSVLHKMIKQVTENYEKFSFYKANKIIYNFCIVELSSFYLDILKDRLYTFNADSKARRSAQTVLYQILSALTVLIAPVLSFTAEEAYGFSCGEKEESIFLTKWPDFNPRYIDKKLNNTWKFILDVRNCVLKVLEQARGAKLIGNSLEAKIIIFYAKEDKSISELLEKYLKNFSGIFIVSQVEISSSCDHEDLPDYDVNIFHGDGNFVNSKIKIKVEHADGQKCIRCWNYSMNVGQDKEHPKLCKRCVNNIETVNE
ncbi:MAG: isoleucine--tRNA ligase [Candidatus Omnitrophota bacterium]|nr:MAG: isoleucine--tRNA ligase [Candidatus Omnitrophota bacterium]